MKSPGGGAAPRKRAAPSPFLKNLAYAGFMRLRRAGTDLDVDAVVAKALPPSVELDRFRLSRRQIHSGRGTELDPVRQMDLDANLRDCRVRRVLDRAAEHTLRAVVADDQPDPCANFRGRLRYRILRTGFTRLAPLLFGSMHLAGCRRSAIAVDGGDGGGDGEDSQ